MKPSYEELEEQLNRSRRLCDAALANERAWETAMMQACGEDGPKSVADKFAALEARCAALAAENAGLKDLARSWANATDDRLFEEHGEIFHDSIDACEEELKAVCPTTDAFLAEVRASAIDSLVDIKTKQLADMHPDTHAFGATAMTIRSQINELQMFASQLRQEAAQ